MGAGGGRRGGRLGAKLRGAADAAAAGRRAARAAARGDGVRGAGAGAPPAPRPPQPAGARPARSDRLLLQCERRCEEEERAQRGAAEGDEGAEDEVLLALLPAEAEWAAARVLLASPLRRRELLTQLLDTRTPFSVRYTRTRLLYGPIALCSLVSLIISLRS